MTRFLSGVLFFAIAALPYLGMLWSERPASPAPDAAAETLTIMSPHRREVRLEYSRAFGEWMRRVHGRNVVVRWLDAGGTAKMLKDLESRYTTSPDRPGVDLLFGGGISPYLTATRQGWLETVAVPSNILAAIPPAVAGAPVYDPDGRWFGVALSSFGILYNRILIERMGLPTPASWEDLGRPEFFTWIASGDPRSSGSVHMCYEIILQVYGLERGWDLLTRISANVRNFAESGSSTPREVAAGEVAAGMVIDQYAQTVIDAVGGDALVLVLPRHATVIGADAIAALKGSAVPDLARLFIEYSLSEPGQRLLFQTAGTAGQQSSLFRMPVRRDLYDDPQAPKARPYDMEAGFIYDDPKGSRRWRIINDLVGVWLIDSHRDLVDAWGAVLSAGSLPEQVAALGRTPVTEAELEDLIKRWDDSRARLDVMNGWAESARQRYQGVRQAADRARTARAKGVTIDERVEP